MEKNKKKTIPQSKEWSISIECFNNKENKIDLSSEYVIEKIKHETHYYFGITHDKDIAMNGEIRKPHIHLIIKLKTKITLNGILKKLESIIQIHRDRISAEITRSQDLVIRYLLHLDHPSKYQYAPFEIITNRNDILNNALKGESEREDITAENLIITVEKHGGNKLKIMSEIGLRNYTRFRGTIADIIQELELEDIKKDTIERARAITEKADLISYRKLEHANKAIDKKITEKVAEIEKKVINTKAVELLNKKKSRL